MKCLWKSIKSFWPDPLNFMQYTFKFEKMISDLAHQISFRPRFLPFLLKLYIYKIYILFINKMSLETNKEFLTRLYIFRDIWVQTRKFVWKFYPIFFSGHHIGFKINFILNWLYIIRFLRVLLFPPPMKLTATI